MEFSFAFLNIYLKIKSIVKQSIVDCASEPCGFLHKPQRVIEAMNNSMQRCEYLMLVVDFRRNIDTIFSFIHDTLSNPNWKMVVSKVKYKMYLEDYIYSVQIRANGYRPK